MTTGTEIAEAAAAIVARNPPYVYGGKGPNSFDCSGFVRQALIDVGITTPILTSTAQQELWIVSDLKDEQDDPPAGTILFRPAGNGKTAHNAIADGTAGCYHAASPSIGVVHLKNASSIGFTKIGRVPGVNYNEGGSSNMVSAAQVKKNALASVGKARNSGMCEKFTRTCFGFPAKYGSARLAFEASRRSGAIHTDMNPPAGVPVFWDILSGVNAQFDHVAVSVGGGYCVSTSAGPGGTIAKVKIADLTRRWGMRYRGWSEWYHEKRVYTPASKGSNTQTPTTRYPDGPSGIMPYNLNHAWSKFLGALNYGGDAITRIQKWLRASGDYPYRPDGKWGEATTKGLQKRLKRAFLSEKAPKVLLDPGPADGVRGEKTRKAEQAYLAKFARRVR